MQHVVFGKLLEGQRLLNKIEAEAGSSSGEPQVPVTIEDCGELGQGGEAAGAVSTGETTSAADVEKAQGSAAASDGAADAKEAAANV